MDDEVEICDLPCPACGNDSTLTQPCDLCGGDGFREYDDAPDEQGEGWSIADNSRHRYKILSRRSALTRALEGK
jgi:hypothetical protein